MNLYDSGVGQHRGTKPPLHHDSNKYNNNMNNNNNDCPMWTNDIVILSVINNSNNNTMAEIGCIILSSDLHEKESFSFNFSLDNSFEQQSDYIYNSLNNRIWIMNDISTQAIINNSFKSINKQIPQQRQIINTQQIFNDNKINNNLITYSNARTACTDIYYTLQRIAMKQLLSQFTTPNFIDNSINNRLLPTQIQQQLQQQVIEEPIQMQQPQPPPPVQPQPPNNINTINNTITTDEYVNDNNKPSDPINNIQPIIDYNINTNNINNEQDAQAQEVQSQQQINDINVNNIDINERNGFHDNNNNNEPAEDVVQPIEKMEQELVDKPIQPLVVEDKVLSDKVLEEKTEQSQSESIQSQPSQPPSQPSPQPVQQQQQQQPQQPQSNIKLTWANKFKNKKIKPTKRSTRVGVVDHLTENIIGRGGYNSPNIKVTGTNRIRNYINSAINNNRVIWVSYNGHQKPFIPRAIRPISWDNRNNTKESFFAIQHKSKSQNQQRFYLKNVIEARSIQWRISNEELMKLKKGNMAQYNTSHTYDNNNYSNRQRYKNTRPRPYNNNNINIDK